MTLAATEPGQCAGPGRGQHVPACYARELLDCPGCYNPFWCLVILCQPDPLAGECRCTACDVACPSCASEVHVAASGRSATVAHQDTCPWWLRHQARTGADWDGVCGPRVPCGVSVRNRGPYQAVLTRPDGRLYRPRKVTGYAVNDDDEIVCGIMILGTHDAGRAQPLADKCAVMWAGNGFVATCPVTGWWRDGFQGGRRCWVDDPVQGRAGVWFREITEQSLPVLTARR
jgi:hypothetical protein